MVDKEAILLSVFKAAIGILPCSAAITTLAESVKKVRKPHIRVRSFI